MSDSVQGLLISTMNEILTLSIEGDFDEARILFTEIQPFFGKAQITKLFNKVVSGGGIEAFSKSLFVVLEGSTLSHEEKSTIIEAHQLVSNVLKVDPLLVVVHIKDRGFFAPFANHVIDGVGAIFLERSHIKPNILVHEFTHCALSWGHRFFDEGLAVYMEDKVTQNKLLCNKNKPHRALRHLINNNNTSPDFREIKNIDQETIYSMAALTISWMLDEKGVDALKLFLSSLYGRDENVLISEIFEDRYGVDLNDLQHKLFGGPIESSLGAEFENSDKILRLYRKISCQLIFEEKNEVQKVLDELAGAESTNELLELARLKGEIISVLSSKNYEDDMVKRWKQKALYYVSESDYTLDSFIIRLYLCLLDIRHKRNFMSAAREMRNIMAEALNYFPDSCELKVFSAKMELNNPRGNRDKAISDLNKIACVKCTP